MESFSKEEITFAIALLGAVLGIMNVVISIVNSWRIIDRDRVKLMVIPKQAQFIGNGCFTSINREVPQTFSKGMPVQLCIEITNLSTFPVTVGRIGILYRNTNVRGHLPQPILIDGGTFPRRLEPRSSFTAYFSPDAELISKDGNASYCVFAETDCGRLFKGDSPALQQLIDNYHTANNG